MMRILFYSDHTNALEERLLNKIHGIIPNNKVHICSNIQSLKNGLLFSADRDIIGIFLCANENDLTNLLSIRECLTGIRIILIVPNDNIQTIAKACQLSPRFVSSVEDENFMEVMAVLEKMRNAVAA